MKCPFKVNTSYPSQEGQNWGNQYWADCEEAACPLYAGGSCLRVQEIAAAAAYFEWAITQSSTPSSAPA